MKKHECCQETKYIIHGVFSGKEVYQLSLSDTKISNIGERPYVLASGAIVDIKYCPWCKDKLNETNT